MLSNKGIKQLSIHDTTADDDLLKTHKKDQVWAGCSQVVPDSVPHIVIISMASQISWKYLRDINIIVNWSEAKPLLNWNISAETLDTVSMELADTWEVLVLR